MMNIPTGIFIFEGVFTIIVPLYCSRYFSLFYWLLCKLNIFVLFILCWFMGLKLAQFLDSTLILRWLVIIGEVYPHLLSLFSLCVLQMGCVLLVYVLSKGKNMYTLCIFPLFNYLKNKHKPHFRHFGCSNHFLELTTVVI